MAVAGTAAEISFLFYPWTQACHNLHFAGSLGLVRVSLVWQPCQDSTLSHHTLLYLLHLVHFILWQGSPYCDQDDLPAKCVFIYITINVTLVTHVVYMYIMTSLLWQGSLHCDGDDTCVTSHSPGVMCDGRAGSRYCSIVPLLIHTPTFV